MRNHHIAIQGSVSSFHDLAAKKYFGEEITVLECGSFREVCDKLSHNLVDYGIIAIENKIAGSILLNYQLIDQFELNIIGEIYLPVELGLLTKKGTELKDIKEIISHPMALGQCQDFLSTLENVKVSEFKDTATSAKLVKDQEGNGLAVIAGPAVAKEHALDTIEGNVCDEKQNFTRFYILSEGAIIQDQPDKASIILTTKNQIGSLSEVLGIIKDQGLNLTKIQSVPIPNNLSQYAFHLDIEFNNLERLETALSNLSDKVKSIKTLGLYKGQTIPVKQNTMNESLIKKDGLIIAGPCSAESEEQLVTTAKRLTKTGMVDVLRAGIWKPRTNPGGFEGVGLKGLSWLSTAKKETGLPVGTEVATSRHVEDALHYDVDVLWIGARTSVNPFSVQNIADALKGTDSTVLIKNPVNPDLKLWIGAVERIRNAGITNIGLIHRGFFYGNKEYRNAPIWQIPIEMMRIFPDLPMICDPSHIAGKRDTLHSVSQKSLDLHYNGLIIESHYKPEEALTDKEQQVSPDQLSNLLNQLVWKKESINLPEYQQKIESLRDQINQFDDELIHLLQSRMIVAENIGQLKKINNVTVLQSNRWNEILEKMLSKSRNTKLSEDFVKSMMELLHVESIRIQNDISNR